MRDQEVQPLVEQWRHRRPFMPRTVTEDVDGKKKRKKSALITPSEKNVRMKKKRRENASGNWRILF